MSFLKWLEELFASLRRIFCLILRPPPTYQPSKWNDVTSGIGHLFPVVQWTRPRLRLVNGVRMSFIQDNNNCYNYACDIITGTFAQPGVGSHLANYQNYDLTYALGSDGVVQQACADDCVCSHKIALVLSDDDFHFYRRDADGMWSHKVAEGPATNLDNSGNVVTDPRTADRGPYSLFIGCFCVDKRKVTIA